MKTFISILFCLVLVATGCSQTITLKFRWDKNTEPDMHSYDLFVLTNPDSLYFESLTEWPADTSIKNVQIDSTIHYPHLLATAAHIHNEIDSMYVEYTYPRSQTYACAYVCANDSARNQSAIARSINIFYIGDRESPGIPKNTIVDVKF